MSCLDTPPPDPWPYVLLCDIAAGSLFLGVCWVVGLGVR